MTPRLRSMVVDGERTILVLDRLGEADPSKLAPLGEAIHAAAERVGLAGAVVFSFPVELEGEQPQERRELSPGQIAALRWAVEKLDADAPHAHVDSLRRLLGMVEGR